SGHSQGRKNLASTPGQDSKPFRRSVLTRPRPKADIPLGATHICYRGKADQPPTDLDDEQTRQCDPIGMGGRACTFRPRYRPSAGPASTGFSNLSGGFKGGAAVTDAFDNCST